MVKNKLYEEISRIRSLISEEELNYDFNYRGELTDGFGVEITLSLPECNVGKIFLLDFDLAKNLDSDLKNFFDGKSNIPFNNKNTLYSHSLGIEEPYRRKGFGSRLKKQIEIFTKNLGYDYITSIVSCDNIGSQNLNKKFNYSVYSNNGIKDLLFKKI